MASLPRWAESVETTTETRICRLGFLVNAMYGTQRKDGQLIVGPVLGLKLVDPVWIDIGYVADFQNDTFSQGIALRARLVSVHGVLPYMRYKMIFDASDFFEIGISLLFPIFEI